MDHWGREAINETFDQIFDEIFDTPRAVEAGIWGVVTGAAAICVLGFSIFGWTLRDTAEQMASERAQTAVVDALAPICVERFRQQPDGPAKLKEFAKTMSWDQRSIIEKGGWATMLGAGSEFRSCRRLRGAAWPHAITRKPRLRLHTLTKVAKSRQGREDVETDTGNLEGRAAGSYRLSSTRGAWAAIAGVTSICLSRIVHTWRYKIETQLDPIGAALSGTQG